MILNNEIVKSKLPKRLSHQNKGDFGHVLVIGGSVGMCGSVCMTGTAALRSGAGLVTVAVPEEISSVVSVKLTESMVLQVPSENGEFCLKSVNKIRKFLPKVKTVVVGMGARTGEGLCAIIDMLLTEFFGTLIIDADGLNVLSKYSYLLETERKCKVILTPHPKEMSRLVSLSVPEIQLNREKIAQNFADKNKCVMVLKGENTVIADGQQTFINSTGNNGMATGGSGDVLAGIIAGLSAQGLNPIESASCGVFLHGRSGDIAVLDKTEYGLIATDLIDYLPKAFLSL